MNIAILSRLPDGGDGWALWHRPSAILEATHATEVAGVLDDVERATRNGHYALGFVTYEAGAAFDQHFRIRAETPDLPLAWFAVFDKFMPYRGDEAGAPAPAIWMPDEDEEDYAASIAGIKEHIAAGDTYQVNYTFRLRANRPLLMKRLFMQLYRAQPARFSMYIETPAFRIASVSPELFFRRTGEAIVCEPMKGTSRRGPHPELDRAAAENLRQSGKNRAENLMIVDMIRNDLGRIAKPGTIQVTDLFKVSPWPTLWQMTSTVQAQTAASLRETFAALFPSASITGAPKLKTSEIIADTEGSPRGLYTGAIGWCGPDEHAEFAVAIRTAVQTTRPLKTTYGIGSGIVWDSESNDEYRECRLKAQVLGYEETGPVTLIETMRWSPRTGFAYREEHLARLKSSADFFGGACDLPALHAALDASVAELPPHDHRVRLVMEPHGEISVQSASLADVPFHLHPGDAPVLSAAIDTGRQSPGLVYLYHKTTHREIYETARGRFPDCDEVLLINEQDELMEFTNGNVVVQRDDQWLTPPLACGLLPGVFRQSLLARGVIREHTIRVNELSAGDHLYFINSVRGWRAIRLVY